MNAAVRPLQKMLLLHTRLFENCLDGSDDERARERPNERTNHLAFLACHIVDTRFYLARLLGGDVESPFPELENVRSVDEMSDVPTLARVRRACSRVTPVLSARFHEITPEELAKEPESKFPIEDETLLGAITFLMHHEAYHIGQMALVRKFLGIGPKSDA